MVNLGFAYRILRAIVEKKELEPSDDPWVWALCYQFYHTFEPGMMTDAIDPLIDFVKDDKNLSVTTRLAALACLSKIGGDTVISKLTAIVSTAPPLYFKSSHELVLAIYDIIEGKEVKLSPRYEILHRFEQDVTDVSDWVKRLDALNALDPNPELTHFLIRQKKALAGQETS